MNLGPAPLDTNTLYPPPPDPITLDFKGDMLMSRLICSTHQIVDARTGMMLVNPDCSTGVIYANERTGRVRYHKRRGSCCYHVRSDSGQVQSKWRRRVLRFFGVREELVIASDAYYAPVRFVPIEGREELALKVRGLYCHRQAVNDEIYEMLDVPQG